MIYIVIITHEYQCMNEEIKKRTLPFTVLIKVFAFLGVIATLTLFAWIFVQGISLLRNTGDSSASAGSTVTTDTSNDTIVFNNITRTLPITEVKQLSWIYNGATVPNEFMFTYSCVNNVTLSIESNGQWFDIPCGSPFIVQGTQTRIKATNTLARFSDIECSVEANGKKSSVVITVFNDTIGATHSTSTTEQQSQNNETTTVTPKPQTTIVPVNKGPADLRVSILETGILKTIKGKEEFFSISPIPTDETAAVTFTVTNKGGETSGSWRFEAELPIEGDPDYEYTSPIQDPLLSGMQMKYTLSFDELREAKSGTIKIRLIPASSSDISSNNTDSISIKIDKE